MYLVQKNKISFFLLKHFYLVGEKAGWPKVVKYENLLPQSKHCSGNV